MHLTQCGQKIWVMNHDFEVGHALFGVMTLRVDESKRDFWVLEGVLFMLDSS